MQFMREVQLKFRKEHKVEYYANALCITLKYLSKVVHQASGRTASEWITDYLILEAKAMLSTSKYSVQQISDMLGFTDQSTFSKYFKRHAGYSPIAYIKEYHRGIHEV